jgi:O-antigen/teichoic acid export membrane protein
VTESRRAVRNAGWVVGQRGVLVVIAALFALLVPRMMGPEVFGRYALLTSVSMWFGLMSGLGAVSLMTRQVPQFVATGDLAGLRKLTTNLLALRASTGVLTAIGYFLLVAFALREHDWVAIACIGGSVFARTVANLCFTLFLGLNRAARWGMGELTRRALILAGVLVGYPIAGLTGACAGFLIANVTVLVMGVIGAREYLDWSLLDLRRAYLSPYLRIGTAFAVGNLMLTLAQQSGETVVRLATSSYTEVGYFGAAHSIYMTGAHALWQAAIAFGPMLVGMMAASGPEAVGLWLSRLFKSMCMLAAGAALVTVFVADDLVPLVLGSEFRPVSATVLPMAFALMPLSLGCVGRLAALVADRPGLSATAAAAELAAFWTIGPLLSSRYGSAGMAVAAFTATSLYAGVIVWRTRPVLRFSLRGGVTAVAIALMLMPLAYFRGTAATNFTLLGVVLVAYVGLLAWRRVVTREELIALRRATRAKPGGPAVVVPPDSGPTPT